MDDNIYAVVDLETTGTNLERDKIIQFACVLVQNEKIINYFSTDVNPLQTIPKNIEHLTGISNQQVASAPYFEDIAPIIRQLISDCIFVAHNVYFDFAFLNSELNRAGEKELTTRCIDTVELSQILFPTSPGFRVSDLAENLSLTHENAHQALSDAYATAELFIRLIDKIKKIPFLTLIKMKDLSYFLGVENYLLFEQAIAVKESFFSKENVFDDIKTIGNISLKNKKYGFKEKNELFDETYPRRVTEKEKLFNSSFVNRKSQVQMMDEINDFLCENKQKNLIIEASTGSGKTLGYLLPLSYDRAQFPITISTSTILLQEQLIETALEQVEQISGNKLFGIVLKSHQHYIDLDKFSKTLTEGVTEQKQYAINQMATLTWLMETETGDLDEINLNKNHSFFDHVKHGGIHTLNKNSAFYKEDFIKFLNDKKKAADVIVVNHAFLCEENRRDIPLIPKSSTLVIDESHKLINQIESKETISLSFNHAYSLLRKLRETEESSLALSHLNNEKLNRSVELLATFAVDVKEDLQWLEQFLIEKAELSDSKREVLFEELEDTSTWPIKMRKNLKELMTILNEMNQIADDFKNEVLKELGMTHVKDYFMLTDYLHFLEGFSNWNKRFSLFFRVHEKINVKWLCVNRNHLKLCMLDFSKLSIQTTSWYKSFKKIIYTSSTLQLDIDSSYFEKQLDIPDAKKIKIVDTFNYRENAKLLVVSQDNNENFKNKKAQVNFISQVIIENKEIGKNSMLVLFTSHQVLKQVYHHLQQYYNQHNVDIYAQGITGTKEKIIKQFTKKTGGIILGANSFWEGIDLNLPELDLIIMTKLPFDPPKRPLVEAKYRYLESQGKNAFYEEAIPQAGMRLRQGLGRLLRSDTDKGIILLLDNRLTKSNYSQQLLSYLPKGLLVEECTLEESLIKTASLFTENN